jgi:hypothetical protein
LLLFLICLYHPTLDKGSFVGIETFPSLFPHKIVKRSVSFALCVTSSCVPNGRFPFLFFDILALPAQIPLLRLSCAILQHLPHTFLPVLP